MNTKIQREKHHCYNTDLWFYKSSFLWFVYHRKYILFDIEKRPEGVIFLAVNFSLLQTEYTNSNLF